MKLITGIIIGLSMSVTAYAEEPCYGTIGNQNLQGVQMEQDVCFIGSLDQQDLYSIETISTDVEYLSIDGFQGVYFLDDEGYIFLAEEPGSQLVPFSSLPRVPGEVERAVKTVEKMQKVRKAIEKKSNTERHEVHKIRKRNPMARKEINKKMKNKPCTKCH